MHRPTDLRELVLKQNQLTFFKPVEFKSVHDTTISKQASDYVKIQFPPSKSKLTTPDDLVSFMKHLTQYTIFIINQGTIESSFGAKFLAQVMLQINNTLFAPRENFRDLYPKVSDLDPSIDFSNLISSR